MSTHGFDIESLLRFEPARFLCERCCALLTQVSTTGGRLLCPACGVEYVRDTYQDVDAYLQSRGYGLQYRDLIHHSRELALIAKQMRGALHTQRGEYPPMRGLLAAFAQAQQFIHFTTYGISALLLGAVKMAAFHVPVRGIISGVRTDAMLRELTTFQHESPYLDLRVIQQDAQFFPHQKIIVIDGLLAFKGSANLTDFGWRKAEQGREVIELVTQVADVVELHNRFFSPVWAGFEPVLNGEKILMAKY